MKVVLLEQKAEDIQKIELLLWKDIQNIKFLETDHVKKKKEDTIQQNDKWKTNITTDTTEI